MKKVLGGILGIVTIIIVAAVLIVFFGWSRVPDMLASRLSDKLKVAVSIDDIHLTTNSINVQKVEVGNPRGYKLPKAFSAEQILATAPLTNYLHDEIVIDSLELDKIYVGIEFDNGKSKNGNWTTIMGNLQSSQQSKPASGKKMLIKKLILTNIDITLAYRDGSKPPHKFQPIARLEFDNVSSEEGLPTEQISNIIFREMLRSVFSQEGIQNMIEGFLQSPQQGIENAIKPFTNFLP